MAEEEDFWETIAEAIVKGETKMLRKMGLNKKNVNDIVCFFSNSRCAKEKLSK